MYFAKIGLSSATAFFGQSFLSVMMAFCNTQWHGQLVSSRRPRLASEKGAAWENGRLRFRSRHPRSVALRVTGEGFAGVLRVLG